MSHAAERVDERLAQAGWDAPQRDKLMGFAEQWAERTNAFSEAVRLQVLPTLIGTKYGDESNGNEVWAVYRGQRLITVMLRRDEQPDANLRVEKVTRLI